MARKRKTVRMLVEVSVPADMPAAVARREVRTLITHQCNYHSHVDQGDVKARKVSAVRPVKSDRTWGRS